MGYLLRGFLSVNLFLKTIFWRNLIELLANIFITHIRFYQSHQTFYEVEA